MELQRGSGTPSPLILFGGQNNVLGVADAQQRTQVADRAADLYRQDRSRSMSQLRNLLLTHAGNDGLGTSCSTRTSKA